MILTISQYIEALSSDEGRFRSLRRLHAVPDDAGLPVFEMPGHGLVDFEVVVNGIRHTLRCPLRRDADSLSKLRAMGKRDRGLGGRFFTEWNPLEREVVLFDETGVPMEVDVLVRTAPQGEPLKDFLEKAASRGDVEAIEAATNSFRELSEWALNAGRSGIATRRLLVTPEGRVSLTGFSANDESPIIAELLRASAARKPLTGAVVEAGGRKTGDYDLSGNEDVRCVRDGAGWVYVDGGNRAVIDTVWISAAPFREGRAEVEADTGKGLIDRDGRTILEPVYEEVTWDDYWGLASVMAEGHWWLMDRNGTRLTTEPYDWLGECSEGMILAQKNGKCGFVDTDGRPVIPCIYDDASSFAEGLAAVTMNGQSFFIDSKGQAI